MEGKNVKKSGSTPNDSYDLTGFFRRSHHIIQMVDRPATGDISPFDVFSMVF
jgi:hypothetical protein